MSEAGLLDRYRPIVGDEFIDGVRRLARPLAGKKVIHVNATRTGGGVAEILERLIILMAELGMEVEWKVIEGTSDFYNVTKKFHNALHGVRISFSEEELRLFNEIQEQNAAQLDLDADYVVIHDPQPVGLIRARKRGTWIWRCHIDVESASEELWGLLRRDIDHYDATLFHLPQYARPVLPPRALVPPAIDAWSEKNRPMEPSEVDALLAGMGIPRDLPLVVQVSRFDRLKDPVGVMQAAKIANERVPCRLVLLGGAASDDPEGVEVLAEVRAAAGDDDRIVILDMPPDSHKEVNALQRAATVVVQKSLREGFGLVVTEAMWKGKALVGGDVGGIRHQVRHGSTGMLCQTVEGCALQILELLTNPEKRELLGRAAAESVRTSYLLPSLLRNYVLLMRSASGIRNSS